MNLIEKKSSFRASTREICNFAFPKSIPRPWRRDIKASMTIGRKKKDVLLLKLLKTVNKLQEEFLFLITQKKSHKKV
jgi:hypothetical protein